MHGNHHDFHSAGEMNAMHTKILTHWNAMHEIMKSNVKANSRENQEITHVFHVKCTPLISIAPEVKTDKMYIHSFGAKTHRKVRLNANLSHPRWQTNVNALRHKVFGDALQGVGDHASLVIVEEAGCCHHGFISRCLRPPMVRHYRHRSVALSPCQGMSGRVSSTLTETCAILHLR